MISSFWNLCRACPSMPVEKQLHSEYRSTFQWHEYVGNRADPSSQTQHHQPQIEQQQNHSQLAVVRQPHRSTQSQVLWASAAKAAVQDNIKRKRHPDILNRTSNGWTTKSTADEIRSQAVHLREQKQGDSLGLGGGGPRKSISMGTIRATENVPVHYQHKISNLTSTTANAGASQPSLEHRVPLDSNKETERFEWTDRESKHDNANMHFSEEVAGGRGGDAQRREYLSEYKKRFRPFSQYEYVDGRFFKKKGDQEIGNPWFHEVIELRKKAGEYRHRGWGTELAPQHMAEVYNQQLWDQVSRRSSLAALALITTTTQKLSKEEKEKENVKRSHPPRSSSRPHTATPKHPLSDLRVDKQKDTETVQKKKPLDGTAIARAARAKARSQSAGPGGRSPRKTARQIVSSYGKTKEGPGGPGWKVQSDSGLVNSQAKPIQRHPRPTTLATSPRPKASSDKGHRDLNSKSVKQLQFDKSSADPSLGCYEPVVKSPPEPTRVKSPEQAILMSPDPVNWTVPLDTSKSFTVTQNIREAPPSPRFRSGERFHGSDGRSIRHPLSGQHSSAGSTMASSPISARSAPVPIHGIATSGVTSLSGLSFSAPTHNTILDRASSFKSSTSREPSASSTIRQKDYPPPGKGYHSDVITTTASACTNERDLGTGGGGGSGSTAGGELALRKSCAETKPHIRSKQPSSIPVNGVEEKRKKESSVNHNQQHQSQNHGDKKDVSREKSSADVKVSNLRQPQQRNSSTPSESIKSNSTAMTKPVLPTSSSSLSSAAASTSIPISVTTSTAATTNTTTTVTPSKSSTTSSASGARNEPSCAKVVPGTTLRCLEDPTFMFDPPSKGSSIPTAPSSGLRRLSSSSTSSSSVPASTASAALSGTVTSAPAPASAALKTTTSTSGSRHLPSSIPSSTARSTSIPTRSNIRVLEAPDTATSVKKQSGIPAPKSDSMSSGTGFDFVPPPPVATVVRQGVEASGFVSDKPPPHTKRTTYRVLDAPDEPTVMYAGGSSAGGRSKASEVLDKARNRFDKFWGKSKDDEK